MPKGAAIIREIGGGVQALTKTWQDIMRERRAEQGQQQLYEMQQQRLGMEKEKFAFEKEKWPYQLEREQASTALTRGQVALTEANTARIQAEEVRKAKQQQEGDVIVDLRDAAKKMGYPPEIEQKFLADAQAAMAIDPTGKGKKRDIQEWMTKFYSTDRAKQFALQTRENYSAAYKKADEEYQKAMEGYEWAKNPDKVNDLFRLRESLREKVQFHGGFVDRIQREMDFKTAMNSPEIQGLPDNVKAQMRAVHLLGGTPKQVLEVVEEYRRGLIGETEKAANWELKQDEQGNWIRINKLTGKVEDVGIKGKEGAGKGLQHVSEDRGDQYRLGTFNPETGQYNWGNWVDKKPSPATEIADKRTQQRFTSQLRSQFNGLGPVKDYRDTNSKYQVMLESLKESKKTNNFVAVDQSLITLFNKMTDPQSVVRESEYVRTPENLALWNRLKGKVEAWKAGGAGLTQADREALVKTSGDFYKVYRNIYKQYENEYRAYATHGGLNPDAVVAPLEQTQPEVTPPQLGKTSEEIPKDKWVKGKIYKNAEGKNAKYLGEGKWQILP